MLTRRETPPDLRADSALLPALWQVATDSGGAVIGQVLVIRGHLGSTPSLGVAPRSVHPDHQRRGVGSALIHEVLATADALDEPLVALLGDSSYYRLFGFHPSVDHVIKPPVTDWQPHFQVCPLTTHDPGVRGTFRYAPPFGRL